MELYPAMPIMMNDKEPRLFPSRQARINLPRYVAALECFIRATLTDPSELLANKHHLDRWRVVLTALMLFDIQLIQGPTTPTSVHYFMKHRGYLYVSMPVHVDLVLALDLNTAVYVDKLFHTLMSSRFHHLRDWHGFDAAFTDFLYDSSQYVALLEAVVLVEMTYDE